MTSNLNTCESSSCSTQSEKTEATQRFAKPQYTVKEGEDAWEVGVVMPGVSRDGVDVSLEKDVLTITGKANREIPESWKVLHQELATADYRLELHLNFEFNGEGISAKVEDGVLSLRFPVSEAAKPKQIAIA
ncbi:MAG: HSP20 family protein [Verrucomicrobiales bacterium]|jgi:HSP20 family protein